jgi:hypothetical protein
MMEICEPMKAFRMWTVFLLMAAVGCLGAAAASLDMETAPSIVQSLDGQWLLATDPENVGREQQWFGAPQAGALPTKVPWIIQDAFPGYHGVAWYWRDFTAPPNPDVEGGYLLRFWAVDYKADVWLNGVAAGSHEGGESPFVLDVTASIKPNETNRLAVRALNPTHQPIDGIVLNETPHRNKALPYRAGSAWNQGGIMDSVELLIVPAVSIEDLFVRPDWKTGDIQIYADVRNATTSAVRARLEFTVAPAATGETHAISRLEAELTPGNALMETKLTVRNPQLWELNDPFLYRVTARVWRDGSNSLDERSLRFGFRDFRFQDGYFRLNGRRLYLRCSHTGNCCPVGLELPHDPDLLRRDLLNVKVMGFNAIRFIAGVAKRYQLDLCDEIGLLVYEECYAGWCLADSPKMAERYDESVLGMIRRDRNHPSVAIWGLLNEANEGPVFRHAVSCLPLVRSVDPTRLVMLNSGSWHQSAANRLAGLESWRTGSGPDPNVTHNPLRVSLAAPWATWEPGGLAFHPGPKGEYSVVRWTVPETGNYEIKARFFGPDNRPTTDVHVLHNGRAIFEGSLNLRNSTNSVSYKGNLLAGKGDTIDFVVGVGNGNYGGDTTGLEAAVLSTEGEVRDAAVDFSTTGNPNGAWSYGYLAPGPKPDASSFQLYAHAETVAGERGIGSLSNPGSSLWEDVLSDQHPYQPVPHTPEIIRKLRTLSGGKNPVFVSEYGVGSAVDLVRVTRHYEALGKEYVEDAQFYRDKLDRFLMDWERWRMAEVFGRPEDFFTESFRKMAGQRLLGLNAIRSNPNVVGYSVTGTVDQGMTGEGLFTTFREVKPGTVDAMFDGFAPLRWCLFVEPVHFYRGQDVRLEAVLANEDVLSPGDYPVRLQVFGPNNQKVWEHQSTVTIASPCDKPQPRFALPVLSEDVAIDGLPGKYRFVAAFERGAAAAGGEVAFYVGDRSLHPKVNAEVVLWGEDVALAKWLSDYGITARPFNRGAAAAREVILAGPRPPSPGGVEVFRELARHLARGSTVVFLSPEVFALERDPVRWVPLAKKGSLAATSDWLYHKDEWAKPHPIFEGLPTGMMDYAFYREIIPAAVWSGQDPPEQAVCGANNASLDYSSGLMLSVHAFGDGRFILNTLRIRENLGKHPVTDRLLFNLIQYAGLDRQRPLAELPADFEEQLKAIGYR